MSKVIPSIAIRRLEDARAVQQKLNGVVEIGGHPIKAILVWVSALSYQIGMQDIGVDAGELDDDEGEGGGLEGVAPYVVKGKWITHEQSPELLHERQRKEAKWQSEESHVGGTA